MVTFIIYGMVIVAMLNIAIALLSYHTELFKDEFWGLVAFLIQKLSILFALFILCCTISLAIDRYDELSQYVVITKKGEEFKLNSFPGCRDTNVSVTKNGDVVYIPMSEVEKVYKKSDDKTSEVKNEK